MKKCASQGSKWHRWDPHLHAPGTLRNDQFKGDWEGYLSRIEQSEPRIRALGITDYFSIATYQAVRRWKNQGRLPDVDLIFPNVEMRLTLETEKRKAINFHLLFSPDDPDHEAEILRLLARLTFRGTNRTYSCTAVELEALGREVDPKQTDPLGARQIGANQFKVSVDDLRELFEHEEWMRANSLAAVAAKEGDGLSSLKHDASFFLTHRKIAAFSDVIFSAAPSDRLFWLGKKEGYDRGYLNEHFGGLRPCLQGCDAHDVATVGRTAENRYCWIRADVTFDGLRQAVLEPELRVALDEQPPVPASHRCIEAVRFMGARPWLTVDELPLNDGLVAIIGERGSGKTALADLIACGANAHDAGLAGSTSFLTRAMHLVGKAAVDLVWADGSSGPRPLVVDALDTVEAPPPQVRYLSQHFVENLCSNDGLARELVHEIERVVFEAIAQPDRLDANSFADLRSRRVEAIELRRAEHEEAIRSATAAIEREDASIAVAERAEKDVKDLRPKIDVLITKVNELAPKGKEEQARQCSAIAQLVTEKEGVLGGLRTRIAKLDDLRVASQTLLDSHARRVRQWREHEYLMCGLSDDDWKSFDIAYLRDTESLISNARDAAETEATLLDRGPENWSAPADQLPSIDWPLHRLREAHKTAAEALGILASREKLFAKINSELNAHRRRLKTAQDQVNGLGEVKRRRREAVELRREGYAHVFDTFSDEEELLWDLYRPLRGRLDAIGGPIAKLDFYVHRRVDLGAWAAQGERLIDLRLAGTFHGRGRLFEAASSAYSTECDRLILPVVITGSLS